MSEKFCFYDCAICEWVKYGNGLIWAIRTCLWLLVVQRFIKVAQVSNFVWLTIEILFSAYALYYNSWGDVLRYINDSSDLSTSNNSSDDNRFFIGKGGVVSFTSKINATKKQIPVYYRCDFCAEILLFYKFSEEMEGTSLFSWFDKHHVKLHGRYV